MAKTKLFAALLCLVLLLGGALPAAADGTACSVRDSIEHMIEYEADAVGVEGVQALIDGHLALRAGIDAEWYVIALSQYDATLSFDAYADALEQYLAKTRVVSATTRQKYALALVAVGRENTAFVRDTMNDSIGKLGVMSLVFGLHLLNNGLTSEGYTVEEALAALLSLQLSDGGFAVSGDVANADVTAMALQALAPHGERAEVADAIGRALDCLSSLQGEDGGYISYGVANAESCAQVVMALCALGIDPVTDVRFIKNGRTVIDALDSFKVASGGYAHEADGEVSVSATAQALCAYVALWRVENGQPFLYSFEDVNYDPSLIVDKPSTDADVPDGEDSMGYQIPVSLGIGVAAILIIAALFIRKKKKGWRDAILVLVAAALAIVLVMTVRVQTPEQYYGESGDVGAYIGTVTLEIRCDSVAGRDDHIPEDGVIYEMTALSLYEGDTVYDVLVRATKQARILIETSGTGSARYISGVANLHEFDFGERSGWTYAVNGEYPPRGCASYQIADGDSILFRYTTELGTEGTK